MSNGLLLSLILWALCGCGDESRPNIEVIETYNSLSEEEGDRKVLEQMKAMGADLAKPTDVRWYVYLPTKAAARVLAENARAKNWTVKMEESVELGSWLCLCSRDAAPSLEVIAAMRAELATCADTGDVDIDGWEAAIAR